jgi:gluconolactonase
MVRMGLSLGLTVAVALAGLSLCTAGMKQYKIIGKVEALDPEFEKLVPKGAQIEQLAEGFAWTEGPVWIADQKALLFSDIPNNVVNKWTESKGVEVFIKPSGYTGTKKRGGEPGSNGLLLDPEGRLVLCEHGDRRITRIEKDGKKTVLADNYMGKKFNSPNDAVFSSKGRVVLHRSAVWPGEELRRPGTRTRLVRGLPSQSRRQNHPADQGDEPPQRYRSVAG